MLLLLSITIYLAFESITEKHSEEDPILRDVKATLEPFLLQNNIDVLSKIKLMKGDKSFTINKQKVYLCLKDKKTGSYYNKNILIYVLLHELSHVLCDEVGHTEKFSSIFENLLTKAKMQHIYDPRIQVSDDYCS